MVQTNYTHQRLQQKSHMTMTQIWVLGVLMLDAGYWSEPRELGNAGHWFLNFGN
jgi:hypothetical protein